MLTRSVLPHGEDVCQCWWGVDDIQEEVTRVPDLLGVGSFQN